MFIPTCTVNRNELLGAGAGGTVYKGKLSGWLMRKSVAVKVSDLVLVHNKESFTSEVRAHKTIRSIDASGKYLVKTYIVQRTPEKNGLVVMKLYDTDFHDFIMTCTAPNKDLLMRKIFKTICKGVKLLHNKSVAHLDLKPENIMMKKSKPHIGDFGAMMLRNASVPVPASLFRGTRSYAPPEILNGGYFDPFCVDIFSLGVILYAALTKSLPYKKGKFSLHVGRRKLSASAFDLISSMCSFDPFSRPTIAEVLFHPWFRE